MKKIILLIITVTFFASCSDNLEDLNQNVTAPSSVSGESLFVNAQKNLVDQMVDLNVNINNTKLWCQYLQETTYTDESNYDQVGRSIPGRHWSVMYKDVLKDLDEAKKIISATTYSLPEDIASKSNKLEVIEILTVFSYSVLVETFGNVPYTEALDVDNLLPVYDDGLTIYRDLISRLSTAINNLETGNGGFGGDDRLYGGDMSNWKKFANSLKLRMGIVLSDVDNALAKQTVEAAVASGVFTSNADNASYEYLGADPNTNPIHANLVLSGRHDYVAAVTIVDMMNSLEDPRRSLFFLPTDDGTYIGGGIGSTANYSSHSHVAAQVEEATALGVVLDYTEVEFLLAEAAARSFTVGGTTKSHYDAGVTASIEYWGGSAADATTFLARADVDYDTVLAASTATTPWKEVVGNQKWIAMFNRGLESWTSIRLLDFPTLATPAEAVSGFPNRYTYPVIEQTLNGTNYQTASSAIGSDTAEQKLFWDMN